MEKKVIDFSTGTPNIPPTKRIREVLANAALDPKTMFMRLMITRINQGCNRLV